MSSILVADDDYEIRTCLAEVLREYGHDVVEVADGVEVLAALEMIRVDLVLLDLMMPRLDGYDVIRAVNEKADRPPIVLLTASPGKLPPGPIRALRKPVELSVLLDVVDQVCGLAPVAGAILTPPNEAMPRR